MPKENIVIADIVIANIIRNTNCCDRKCGTKRSINNIYCFNPIDMFVLTTRVLKVSIFKLMIVIEMLIRRRNMMIMRRMTVITVIRKKRKKKKIS